MNLDPNILNFGPASGVFFPNWSNNIPPLRKQIPVALSSCHRVHVNEVHLLHFHRTRPGSETSHSSYLLKHFSSFSVTAFKTFISTFGPYFLCSGDAAFLSRFPWAVSVIQCKPPLIVTAILEWQHLSWDVELLPGTQECNQNLHLFLKPLSTH